VPHDHDHDDHDGGLTALLRREVDERTPASAPPWTRVADRARGRSRQRRTTAFVAVGTLAAATIAAVSLGQDSGTPDDTLATVPSVSTVPSLSTVPSVSTGPSDDAVTDPTEDRAGEVAFDGSFSCVESYSPEAIPRRGFAFDGTVVDIGPAQSDRGDDGGLDLTGVTFAVSDWFRGGSGETVTVDMFAPSGPGGSGTITSDGNGTVSGGDSSGGGDSDAGGSGASYGVGSRLLVSGEARWGETDPLEDPIGWGCGFTRYHDSRTAAAWQAATAG